jgi:hypothetical protein
MFKIGQKMTKPALKQSLICLDILWSSRIPRSVIPRRIIPLTTAPRTVTATSRPVRRYHM